MHELPVVTELIKIVTREAEEKQLAHITDLYLVIGELSAVIDESVQMYFDLLSQDTPCAGAALHFEHIPAMLKCRKCGREFPHQKSFDCPGCGGDSVLIKGTGREFYLKSIEGE